MMKLHLAPLQGYADHIYLKHHSRIYGGLDELYTPFIRVEKNEPRRQDMIRLQRAASDGIDITPQIIFGSAEEFRILTESLKNTGCTRIDLNLGCPYPMQTGRGRGAAMVGRPEEMERIAAMIRTDNEVAYSVKMRLGMTNPEEWRGVLPVLNSIPLRHIAVHPRVAKQMYAGAIAYDEFAHIAGASLNKVIYNGDVLTPDDIDRRVTDFPDIAGVMAGRGVLARPSLGAEWHRRELWSREQRMEHLMRFHEAVFEEYAATLCGQVQILQKIKPFWDYLEQEIGHRHHKAIKKCTSLDKYRRTISEIRETYLP